MQLAFAKAYELEFDDSNHQISEEIEEYQRPILEQIVSRPFRDATFKKKVRQAYDLRCAVSGLQLINGLGHAEIEAAHIRPVGNDHNGPDSVRNGIALSRTMHWMFDRGVISLSDDYDIMLAKNRVPDEIKQLMQPGGKIILPADSRYYPHPQFLKYHRNHIFIG